jgi:hypothetical protein
LGWHDRQQHTPPKATWMPASQSRCLAAAAHPKSDIAARNSQGLSKPDEGGKPRIQRGRRFLPLSRDQVATSVHQSPKECPKGLGPAKNGSGMMIRTGEMTAGGSLGLGGVISGAQEVGGGGLMA